MKIRIIGLLLSVCLLLSACSIGIPAKLEETKPTEPATQPQEQETLAIQPQEQETQPVEQKRPTPGPVFDKIPSMEDYYQYGNMQTNIGSGDFLLYKDQVVFDAVAEHFLCAYDLRTGQVRYFCDKTGCDHTGDNCQFVDIGYWNFEQYGGKYYSRYEGSAVCVLENGKWEKTTGRGKRFWHANGDLFVLNQDWDLQVYANGQGEPKTLVEDFGTYQNVVFDNYVYGNNNSTLYRVDLNAENCVRETVLEKVFPKVDGDHIYCVDYYYDEEAQKGGTYYLYRTDMDGNNKEMLLETPVLPASLNFDDDYVYFRQFRGYKIENTVDSRDIYRMSKKDPTKIEKIATLPEDVFQIFTVPGVDILFVTGNIYDNDYGVQKQSIYVMNTDGSNLVQLEIPGF